MTNLVKPRRGQGLVQIFSFRVYFEWTFYTNTFIRSLWRECVDRVKCNFKMGVWLAVKTQRGLNSSSTSRACEMEANSSFGDLSFRFIGEGDTIDKIELSSTKMGVQTTTPISVCNQFGAFSVEIFIRVPEEEMDTNPKSSSIQGAMCIFSHDGKCKRARTAKQERPG